MVVILCPMCNEANNPRRSECEVCSWPLDQNPLKDKNNAKEKSEWATEPPTKRQLKQVLILRTKLKVMMPALVVWKHEGLNMMTDDPRTRTECEYVIGSMINMGKSIVDGKKKRDAFEQRLAGHHPGD